MEKQLWDKVVNINQNNKEQNIKNYIESMYVYVFM